MTKSINDLNTTKRIYNYPQPTKVTRNNVNHAAARTGSVNAGAMY